MVLGEEAFFEEQKLVLGAGGVVDDGDEGALEIDFDAGEQLGERGFLEEVLIEHPVGIRGEGEAVAGIVVARDGVLVDEKRHKT